MLMKIYILNLFAAEFYVTLLFVCKVIIGLMYCKSHKCMIFDTDALPASAKTLMLAGFLFLFCFLKGVGVGECLNESFKTLLLPSSFMHL